MTDGRVIGIKFICCNPGISFVPGGSVVIAGEVDGDVVLAEGFSLE